MKYIRNQNGNEQFIILDDKYFIDLVNCHVDQGLGAVKSMLEDESLTKIDCQWNMLSDTHWPCYQISFTYETKYIVFINEWRNIDSSNVSFMLFKKCWNKKLAISSSTNGYSLCVLLDQLSDTNNLVFNLHDMKFEQVPNSIGRIKDIGINYEGDDLYYTEGVYVQKNLYYELGKIYMHMDNKGKISCMSGFSFNSRRGATVKLEPFSFTLKPLSLSKKLI